MKKDNKETGRYGEDLAVRYLENLGYKIQERNFRTRFGEVDIVCWDGGILVFVEVKTKKGHDFGEPEEMVNRRKLQQVQRMGEIYVEMKKEISEKRNMKWKGLCRVDVVTVVLEVSGETEKICHYKAVY